MAQEQTTGAVGATSNGTATTGTNITPTTPTPVATTNNNNVSVTDAAQNAAALASAIPLAQLLSKPGALNALTSLTALGGLTDLLGGLSNLGPPVQTTGVHRAKQFTSRQRPTSNNPNINSNDVNKLKSERSKFNPY